MLGINKLFKFSFSEGKNDVYKYIKKFIWQDFECQYNKKTQELKECIVYELSVIKKIGFISYFLIIQDFIM